MRYAMPTASTRRCMLSGRPDRVRGHDRAGARCAPVRRWVDAFDARDIEGMLACLDPEVRFHPLRLNGLDGSYRGHGGVQRWFAQLTPLHHDYVISLVRGSGDNEVLAVGELRLAGNCRSRLFAHCIGSPTA